MYSKKRLPCKEIWETLSQKNVRVLNWYLKVYFTIYLDRLHLLKTHTKKPRNKSKGADSWKSLVKIPYGKWVKHFGVIAMLYHILYHSILYTYKGHLSSHIYYIIIFGSMEFLFFPSNNACLLLNKHRSAADLTQYLFQYLGRPLANSVKHLTAERKVVGSILLRPD